MHDFINSR